MNRPYSNLFDDLFGNILPLDRDLAITESTIEIDVPGCTSADIDVSLVDTLLTIKWTRKGHENMRQFRVQRQVEPSAITATVKDGVLTVQLPKTVKRDDRARKIPVT